MVFTDKSKLKLIGDFTFAGCVKITKITIPATVRSIGEGAFDYAEMLNTVIFDVDSDIESIGAYAFAYTRIRSINVPEGVDIGTRAFYESGCDETLFEAGVIITDCDSSSCTENKNDNFFLKTKSGKELTKPCKWLEKKDDKTTRKVCSKIVERGVVGDVRAAPAQDVCRNSCDSCGACYQNNNSMFSTGVGRETSTCAKLKKMNKRKKKKMCKLKVSTGIYGLAKAVCVVICGTNGC